MGIEIKVPKIAGVSKLSIGRWFKRVGDPVSIGEPLVEIDTYNLTHEIQAPAYQKTPINQVASILVWRWHEMEQLLGLVAGPALYELPINRTSKPKQLPL